MDIAWGDIVGEVDRGGFRGDPGDDGFEGTDEAVDEAEVCGEGDGLAGRANPRASLRGAGWFCNTGALGFGTAGVHWGGADDWFWGLVSGRGGGNGGLDLVGFST